MEFLDAQTWELVGRYLGAGLALGLGGIGAAVGMGLSAGKANEAIMRQPSQQGSLLRTMLIGQAVGGSPSIFALVIGLLILFKPAGGDVVGSTFAAVAIGAGISIGLGCFGSGLGCGWPGGSACEGVARNPRQSTSITSSMIIGQAVAQSPSIFATVVALIFLFRAPNVTGLAAFGVCLGAGIAMGAGALGPGIGSGTAAGGAVHGSSRWPQASGSTLRTMLIAQAVSQTPAIFGMLVAFIMLFALPDLDLGIEGFAKTMGAGIAAGFGGIGPGIGSGTAGDYACRVTAARPRIDALTLRTMLIGQAVSQSTAIYALIIALLLLFVV